MRHNQNGQNGRRFRGRSNNSHGQNNQGNHGNHNSGGNNHNRRINPRVHTFDSNGPDVRIRGNAMQITEKYLTLARDAQGAGDRVLAESYLQHAEHYQRMLNELTEEQNRQQQLQQQQQQNHSQNQHDNNGRQQQRNADAQGDDNNNGTGDQPDVPLDDLDQGFLVGKRNGSGKAAEANAKPAGNNSKADDSAEGDADKAPARAPRRASGRQKASETA